MIVFLPVFRGHIREFVRKNLNLFLMVSILGLMFSPVLNKVFSEGYIQQFFFTIMFLTSVIAVRTNHNRLLYVAVLLSILSWVNMLYVTSAAFIITVNHIFFTIYFAYVLFRLVMQLIKVEEVNSNVIMEAVNIYLLIGVQGAIVLNLINYYSPGAIAAISPDAPIHEYLYFSFVTLTTLGYGDISPSVPITKTIVVFLAIVGQFYIAVIMAFLVSKYISTQNNNN